ncbi:MAG: hypothetical protein H6739_32385 [Alphaproteobacteria bacterium]|nr:hypothetical protein [Alphaproteobacteria bacterium]
MALRLAPLLLLLSCVRTLQLGGDDSAVADDTDVTDDSAAPSVCLPASATGFAMPGGRWALASLYGARRVDDLEDSALQLSPSWFLASAWQATAFGCGDFGDPWTPSASTEADGCLRVQEGTHWVELCRLYPGIFGCDAREELVSGDHVEGSVVAVAWHAYAAHALLQRFDVDPDAWLAQASDPRAGEKLAALLHFEGAWSWHIEDVIAGCGDDITACLDGEGLRHVEGVADKLDRLEAAPCYDEPLALADVERFLEELALLWPQEDWSAVRDEVTAVVDDRGFTEAGPAALDALDGALDQRLICPERELWDSYRYSCP